MGTLVVNRKTAQFPDDLIMLRSIESKLPQLLKDFGVKQCACCFQLKINSFPFFEDSNICMTCEDEILNNTPAFRACVQ